MEIQKFSWKTVGIKPISLSADVLSKSTRKRLQTNTDNYIKWAVDLLQRVTGHKLQTGQRFDATAIYMNLRNINDILRHSIYTTTWLSFAPRVLDNLQDDEVAICVKEAITNVNNY